MDKIECAVEKPLPDEIAKRASRHLLREAIGYYGLNNFESALNAVESFLCDIELFDPDIAFGAAANAFLQAALAFALLDDNHDRLLSRSEVASHAAESDNTLKSILEWVLLHHDALRNCRLYHHDSGISRRDLLSAANFFSGLEHIHFNFDKIAEHHDLPGKSLTHQDILRYTFSRGKSLPGPERRSLLHVARYLQQLERKGIPSINENTLNGLTPESIWYG